jgi:hypothetical protein
MVKDKHASYGAEYMERDEDLRFRSSPVLPDPSLPYFKRNSIGIRELLSSAFTDCSVTAILKRIANDGHVDEQFLVNVLACALHSDDPSYTAYNALVLLEYFTVNRIVHGLSESSFASAVSGLSFHNGPIGNTGMHRLSDPREIAGAAAVIKFIGTMNRNRLVKPSTLQHAAINGRKELTISSRYLDRLLRTNPTSLRLVCDFLRESRIGLTRKALQPVIDHVEANGVRVLGMD